MKTKVFCNYCGARLENHFLEGKDRQVCEGCGQIYYENPLPVVSVIVANENRELLLVRRAREPAKDMWCFPIGFAESGESIQDAAMRELKEEAGVDGKILQIIDVFSEYTEPYGEVLVVSFEAEKTGGVEKGGDDACDARYFPVTNLPKLAFGSQEQALKKFVEAKRDSWDMSDSFRRLVVGTTQTGTFPHEKLLSDELIDVIESNRDRIIELWMEDIATNPSTRGFHHFQAERLTPWAVYLISHIAAWLKGGKAEMELGQFYSALEGQGRQERVPLEEIISCLSILKKHVFRFTSLAGFWYKPVDLYRVLELGERLVYFFDRAAYQAVAGYGKEQKCQG